MMAPDPHSLIADVSQLRARYHEPAAGTINKAIDHVDENAAAFLSQSPLFVLASSDGTSTDASPRGGPPGFVVVLDQQRLAFGDLQGNNRLDSYVNLLSHPNVGLLFFIPGSEETMRVNGTASITTDETICRLCTVNARTPKTAIVLAVEELFLHCGAALRRANVWDVASWPNAKDRPTAGEIFQAHMALDINPVTIDEGLATYYESAAWEPGGLDV